MKYTILSHLYYKDRDEYTKLISSRLNSEGTTHLPFEIHDNPVFFCLCPEIFTLQEDIMKADKKIYAIREKLPGVALEQFTKRSLIDEIVLTNNIEGVHSSRREIGDTLESIKEKSTKKRFFGLVNKYNLLNSDKISLKTCKDIRRIYDDLVLDEVVEDDPKNAPDGYLFRKDLAEVKTGTEKIIHKGSFPETKITVEMNHALTILNDNTIPVIVRISIFHYLFGYIHPFYDGNGRTSRFISSYLLAQNFEPLIGYRLSYTIQENIHKYNKAFQICNDAKSCGDITPFIITFMEFIKESMNNLEFALFKRLSDLNNFMEKLKDLTCFRDQDSNNFCGVLIQAALFSESGITKKELQNAFDISPVTVDKRLQYVEKYGYLKKQKNGRPYYYEFDIDKLKEQD